MQKPRVKRALPVIGVESTRRAGPRVVGLLVGRDGVPSKHVRPAWDLREAGRYELAAKWHGRLAWDEFPLQYEFPTGLGFSPQDRQLFVKRFGIATEDRWIRVDQLRSMLREQCAQDLPPLISDFSRATIVYGDAIEVKRGYHIFVGASDENDHHFDSRAFNHNDPFFIWLPQIYQIQCISYVLPLPRSEVHCLLHSP
jgi:hypothetical protein